VRSALTGNVPHEMSSAEISEIIDAFVAASSRVRAGGLDGIELLSAFGFLPHAFLSPLNNRRTDGYGGSLKNRMRFLLELVELEVRELLSEYEFPGDDTPVVRVSALKAMDGAAAAGEQVLELMSQVDEFIPEPKRDFEKPFLMPIEDVFSITGRGTVVTGRVEQGKVNTGDSIEIVGIRETQTTVCTGVEMFRKILDEGQAGDNIGALLRGIDKDEVQRGQVLAAPKSITPHTHFEAQVYVLTKEEGGRHKPFFTNYRPQFYFRTTDVTGMISLPEGTEMCIPGDNTTMVVELIAPIAMDEGLRFAIREGGRTVGAGAVTKILN